MFLQELHVSVLKDNLQIPGLLLEGLQIVVDFQMLVGKWIYRESLQEWKWPRAKQTFWNAIGKDLKQLHRSPKKGGLEAPQAAKAELTADRGNQVIPDSQWSEAPREDNLAWAMTQGELGHRESHLTPGLINHVSLPISKGVTFTSKAKKGSRRDKPHKTGMNRSEAPREDNLEMYRRDKPQMLRKS